MGTGEGYHQNPTNLGTMNQTQSYIDVHSSHLPSPQTYTTQAGPVETMPHYQYQQPPLLQPGPTAYAPTTSAYQYGYNPVTSPQSSSQSVTNSLAPHIPASILPLPAMATNPNQHYSGSNNHNQPYNVPHTFDTTGQIAPPGMKPRVTATLWEDEGSLCFQVEAKGVCVARREDNHMVNGTKLLNVAGMTRGRRDGILKSEKVRHVVKIGPMHLKGVWIPYDRALEFANKEKITELLYPLFVHNIGSLLYHPANPTRPNPSIVAATERRRIDASQAQARSMQGPPPPPLHHHHSMHNPVTTQVSQSSSQALIPPGRPHFERAHTFPTPPTSANSMVGVPNQGNSYEWTNNVHNSHSLSIDTGLGNSRSMPTTPATTPPGSNMQSMQSYQNQSGYDSKPYYSSGSASQAQYASQQQPAPQNMPRYEGGSEKPREGDSNLGGANRYYHSQGNGQVTQASTGGENAPEHETDYVNDSNNAYNSNRSSYNYSNNHSSGNIHSDQNHLSSDIATTQASTNGSDRLNSRSTGGQSQWTSGYSTPRLAPPPSTHYNVVSDTRSTSANGNNGDSYSASSNAAPVYTSSSMNGGSNKRSRDDSDHEEPAPRPASQNCESGAYEHKRRKTLTENPVGGPVGGAPLTVQSLKNGSAPRRR